MFKERERTLHLKWNWHKEGGLLKGILNPSHHFELKFDNPHEQTELPSKYQIFYTFGQSDSHSVWNEIPQEIVYPVDENNSWQIETRTVLAQLFEQMEYGSDTEIIFKAIPLKDNP